MTAPAIKMLLAGGAAAAFDPVTSIPWAHLYYAGGPAFVALGLSNGASMSSTNWPDEISTNNSPLNAGTGTYRSADAAINSKPCIEMTGSGVDGKNHSATLGGAASVSAPLSIICVFQLDAVGAGHYVYDGTPAGGSRFALQASPFASSAWGILSGGTSGSGGTASTGIHATRHYHTAAASNILRVDAAGIVSVASGGAASWPGATVGGVAGAPMDGRVAFWGIYSGDITAHGSWSALISWVSSQYGATLS